MSVSRGRVLNCRTNVIHVWPVAAVSPWAQSLSNKKTIVFRDGAALLKPVPGDCKTCKQHSTLLRDIIA